MTTEASQVGYGCITDEDRIRLRYPFARGVGNEGYWIKCGGARLRNWACVKAGWPHQLSGTIDTKVSK